MLHNIAGSTNMGWIFCNGGCWNLPFDWQAGATGPEDITEWHMYTGTFDSKTGDWKLYIDELRQKLRQSSQRRDCCP